MPEPAPPHPERLAALEAFDAMGEERTEEQRHQCTGRLRLSVVLYKECYGPAPLGW